MLTGSFSGIIGAEGDSKALASTKSPEEQAREEIDRQLVSAGWVVQDRDAINLSAGRGIAIREFKLADGYGFADYLLYVDKQAVGALEAKPAGHTLSGVKPQVDKYSKGLPGNLPAPIRPLPFLYVSTGVETTFINLFDPEPRSRRVFSFHRPETIAEWMQAGAFITSRSASHDAARRDCWPLGEQTARPGKPRKVISRGSPARPDTDGDR